MIYGCRLAQGRPVLLTFIADLRRGKPNPLEATILQVSKTWLKVTLDVSDADAIQARCLTLGEENGLRVDSAPQRNLTARRQLDAIKQLKEVQDPNNAHEVCPV
jgi:hypothetical protein